ncbi:MAG: tRNA (adenosine(37)-N6)-threonylcarbamoyltransferase complex dimerization subunit type 1 TsaB [Candidatus Peribacteraceae bacterium]|nr:tRNA (adenosine(37)-N6)-threonylcarbamoyltransferase complex dimerization subunit type 1 TsaB [Candidatus Peribacteraceae bacterium]
MRALFLDIASHTGLLACVQDDGVRSIRMIDQRIRDHDLVMLAEESLTEAKWQYRDLTHLACVTGPGGFTSLRVGAAFINTLADQLKIPVAGIHLSDLCAARSAAKDDFLWLHSTKAQELFVRGFGSFAPLWSAPILLILSDAVRCVPAGAPWVGELLPAQRDALVPLHLQEASMLSLPDILPTFLKCQPFRLKPVQPWYGRSG